MSLANDVKSLALELGADLVGIAPVERFEGAPKLYHPQNLLPQTKSVISNTLPIKNFGHSLPTTPGMIVNPQRVLQFTGDKWITRFRRLPKYQNKQCRPQYDSDPQHSSQG